MSTKTALVGAGSLVALLTLAAGCGGSDPDPAAAEPTAASSDASGIDAAFVDRADATCRPYADYARTHLFDLKHFNRYAPDPAALPEVASYLEQIPAYQELVPELEALGDPEAGGTEWATVLDDLRTNAGTVSDQVADARSGGARFADLARRQEAEVTTMLTDLSAAGLVDTACAKAEGDPLRGADSGG
jgi:hypothetical protein